MEETGEQFLHKKDSRLHLSPFVEHEMRRKKRKGEEVSQKPSDKIADWLKVIEQTHLGHRDDPMVAERIKKYYHERYVLEPKEIPENYFENQRRLAREMGHGDIEITEEMKSQLSEVIINDQKFTLDNWIDYFISPDSDCYPMWAKYWAFTGMLKLGAYNKEKHAFAKRDKTTVAPYSDLNREAFAYVIDAIIEKASKKKITMAEDNPELKRLLEGANFGKLYAYAIEKVTPVEESELLNTRGKWVKFPVGSDPLTFIPENFDQALVPSLQGHGTGWCTAGESTAQAQLEGGDFYVYYSCDKSGQMIIPRVAIRMEYTRIAEVRGIAPEQNLDPYIGDVLEKKLEEFGQEGIVYKKRVADMKRLTEIDRKNKKGKELTREDLRFLYEFDSEIEGFGYRGDPRIEEILANRDFMSDLSLITGYPEEQISTTKDQALGGGFKLHYGFLYLRYLKLARGVILPERIVGSLDLNRLRSAKGLTLPKIVDGNLDLYSLNSPEGLELPNIVGGNLNLRNLWSATGLTLPDTVGGTLSLYSIRSAKKLTMPKTVGGNLVLSNLESAKGLKFPKTVGDSIYLRRLESAKGLELPNTVGGDVILGSLPPAEEEKLRIKYPNLRFLD